MIDDKNRLIAEAWEYIARWEMLKERDRKRNEYGFNDLGVAAIINCDEEAKLAGQLAAAALKAEIIPRTIANRRNLSCWIWRNGTRCLGLRVQPKGQECPPGLRALMNELLDHLDELADYPPVQPIFKKWFRVRMVSMKQFDNQGEYWLTTEQAAARTGYAVSTLTRLRKQGKVRTRGQGAAREWDCVSLLDYRLDAEERRKRTTFSPAGKIPA